jgi:hypothetical protein
MAKVTQPKGEISMAKHHRIFIAFAIEDKWARDYLVGQALNAKSSFAFTDMSVKEPWDEKWKTQCRARIKECDGVIALVSRNTAKATGQLWEIEAANQERIPILGIYTTVDDRPVALPTVLSGLSVKSWTWDNISTFLSKL